MAGYTRFWANKDPDCHNVMSILFSFGFGAQQAEFWGWRHHNFTVGIWEISK